MCLRFAGEPARPTVFRQLLIKSGHGYVTFLSISFPNRFTGAGGVETTAVRGSVRMARDLAGHDHVRPDRDPDQVHSATEEMAVQFHLANPHPIEQEALVNMKLAPEIAGDPEVADASSSKIKDAARRLAAVNSGGSFSAQPETPAKLAGFEEASERTATLHTPFDAAVDAALGEQGVTAS